MTGVWIGAALLILVVFPIVVVLLKGVLDAAAGLVPIELVAAYGGSLDVILDDAGPAA